MLALDSQESPALLPTSFLFRFCRPDHCRQLACFCHQQLFGLRCLPAGTEEGGGGAQQEGAAKISDMKGSNTASAKLTQ